LANLVAAEQLQQADKFLFKKHQNREWPSCLCAAL